MLNIAVEAARTAGAYLRQHLGKVRDIRLKGGQEKNLVTEIDKASEELIISMIRRHFPSHNILAEEGGGGTATASDVKWIIDPLDGTTNFTHGFPVFCVSIAVEQRGEVVAGVIYDPNFDELFTAEKGKGAFLNGKRMRVSAAGSLRQSLLVTGFPYNIAENPDFAIEHFVDFLIEAQAVRRMGSAAIDLAYVAAGRYEGFWEVALHPWDVAAGALIVTESGGRMSDFNGGPYSIYDRQALASNGRVHDAMIAVLQKRSGSKGSGPA